MGKKGRKKASSGGGVDVETSRKVETPDALPEISLKKTDLYSQIFPETTDSETDANSQPVVSKAVSKKKKRSTSIVPTISSTTNASACIPTSSGSIEETGARSKNSQGLNIGKEKAGKYVLRNQGDSSDDNDSEGDNFEYAGSDESEEENDEEVEMEVEEANGQESVNSSNERTNSGEDEDEEEEDVDEETERTVLRSQLKDLSFEELEALKQKMGLKEYNEAMFGGKKGKPSNKKKKFERKNLNRPREMSSKVRVPKLREVVKVHKKEGRKDPRFDNSCGEYDEKFWNSEYSFIRDIQKNEADELKQNLKFVDDNKKKREIRSFIQKVADKEKSIVTKDKERKKQHEINVENRKRLEEGKRPFFMKKSTKRLMELAEKYDELKESGGLDKYLKKKRKKNAVRDRKSLKPFS